MKKLTSFIQKALNRLVPSKRKPDFTSAVIVAGGSSTRMGEGVSKQLLEAEGVPIIVHTLLAFEQTPEIDEIVVVAKKEELTLYKKFGVKYKLTKLKKAVEGGSNRQKSAENGFSAISDKSKYVAIHDGARCLITPHDISAVCRAAYEYNAATAAIRATDTIKIASSNGFIEKTIERNKVWLAQTPQVFNTDLYSAALAVGKRDGITVTDDCSLVEHTEHPIKLVECSPNNIKVTTPKDMVYVKTTIRARNKKKATEEEKR